MSLLDQARDRLNGFAELHDCPESRQVVHRIDSESIELQAVVYRCGHNRKLKCVYIDSGPAFVMRHFDNTREGVESLELFRELSELGHEYTVTTRYEEVSILEMADIRQCPNFKSGGTRKTRETAGYPANLTTALAGWHNG